MWVDRDGYVRSENRKPSFMQRVAEAAPTLLVVFMLIIGVVVGANQAEDNEQSDLIARQADAAARQNEISDYERQLKARKVCVKFTNPFRKELRAEFKHIKTRVILPVYAGIAQTIPEGQPSREILDRAVGRIHRRVATLDERFPLVDCASRYPLEDDPRTSLDEAEANHT